MKENNNSFCKAVKKMLITYIVFEQLELVNMFCINVTITTITFNIILLGVVQPIGSQLT